MFTGKIDDIRSYVKSRTSGKCFPHWNWLTVKVLSLLSKYPSGITKAIILAEIQNSWANFSQVQGYRERFKMRKVTVDSVYGSKHVGQDAILEVRVEAVRSIPGTHTNLAVLKNVTSGKQSIEMYLHQKLYQIEDVILKHKLRFTSCRLWKDANVQSLRLLPSENVVILLEGEELDLLGIEFVALEGINIETMQPRYGFNIKVEVSDVGKEQIVHLPNGETSVKKTVTVVDSQHVHASFCLWDEQLPLSNLFKEGDVLAIQQPFIVPNELEGYTLEYGPATIIYCLSRDADQEVILSQVPQSTAVYVTKDNQGMLDYSTYPERILIDDRRSNMMHVTLFGIVIKVTPKEKIEADQCIGHTFSVQMKDESGICDITISDHTRAYHESIYQGQCVVFEGLHSSGQPPSIKLSLETWNGGRLWNASALSGWIATKYLADTPVSLCSVGNYGNCICKAVVTKVLGNNQDGTHSAYVTKVHSACLGKVESCAEQFLYCQKCDASHLNEIPIRENQKASPSRYWQWRYCLSLVLHSSEGSLQARLTDQTAEQLLLIPAVQFALHLTTYTDQVLESVLAQEYYFGISCYHHGEYQIDSVSPIT